MFLNVPKVTFICIFANYSSLPNQPQILGPLQPLLDQDLNNSSGRFRGCPIRDEEVHRSWIGLHPCLTRGTLQQAVHYRTRFKVCVFCCRYDWSTIVQDQMGSGKWQGGSEGPVWLSFLKSVWTVQYDLLCRILAASPMSNRNLEKLWWQGVTRYPITKQSEYLS